MAENNKKYRFETLQLHVGQEQADPANSVWRTMGRAVISS